MRENEFAPGFRLSAFDSIILVIGISAAIGLAMVVWWLGFLVAFVLGHFFLFCNVFRISRPLELVWAGAFMALAAPTITTDTPGWLLTTVFSLIVTLAVVVIEMRKPSYHGAGWRRINPALPERWESQCARSAESARSSAEVSHD